MFGPFGARGTIHEKFRGLARSSALKMERHLCHSAHVDAGCWQSAAGAWPAHQPLLGLDPVPIIARPDHIANTLRKGIIRDCLRLRCARFGDYYESWRNQELQSGATHGRRILFRADERAAFAGYSGEGVADARGSAASSAI